jgi:hypothetical protein
VFLPSFEHDLFRWGKGLGFAKGRVYSELTVPMTTQQLAQTFGYKNARNVRMHLRVLTRAGLVRRLADGRYERGNADLDAVAARLGVLGASDRQRERHRMEQANWWRWSRAFSHWLQTGEVTDPETAELLEVGALPSKYATIRAFRLRVLSLQFGQNSRQGA